MSLRAQLVFAALGAALGVAFLAVGASDAVLLCGMAWGLTFLVGFPRTTLALLLATLSCDQVLNVRLSGAANVRLAHLCALALLLRLTLDRLARREPFRVPSKPLQPLFAYLALAAAGALFSENLPKTVGYLAWALVDVVAVFAVVLDLGRTREGFRFLRQAWCAGALIAAAFGLAQLGLGMAHLPVPLVEQRLGEFPRINGFNYEPAYYALYLEAVAAVYLGRFLRGGAGAWRSLALALVLLLPAALSMSRSGWLGMGLLMGVLAVRGVRQIPGRVLLGTAAALGFAVCVLGLALPQRFLDQAPRMAAMALDPKEQSSSAPRLSMLSQAAAIFREHPVLGVGLGGYGGYVLNHGLNFNPSAEGNPDGIVTSNLWLEVASELGLLGVGVLLWFLVSLLRGLWRAQRTAPDEEGAWAQGLLLSVLLVFGVLYQFNQTLWRLDIWVLLALAWSAVLREQKRREAAVAS